MTKIAKTIAKTNGQSQELALSESVVPAWVVSSPSTQSATRSSVKTRTRRPLRCVSALGRFQLFENLDEPFCYRQTPERVPTSSPLQRRVLEQFFQFSA